MRIIAKRPFDVEKANAGRIALGVWLIDVAAFLAGMFGALIPPAIKRDLRAYLRSVAYQAKRLMLLRAYQLLKMPGRRRQTLRPASAAPGFRVRKRRASAVRHMIRQACRGLNAGSFAERVRGLRALIDNIDTFAQRLLSRIYGGVRARPIVMVRPPALGLAADAPRSAPLPADSS